MSGPYDEPVAPQTPISRPTASRSLLGRRCPRFDISFASRTHKSISLSFFSRFLSRLPSSRRRLSHDKGEDFRLINKSSRNYFTAISFTAFFEELRFLSPPNEDPVQLSSPPIASLFNKLSSLWEKRKFLTKFLMSIIRAQEKIVMFNVVHICT